MSSGVLCPKCGDELPDTIHASASGRFRMCSRDECAAIVPESPKEWRARVQADLDNAEARVIRLHHHIDRIDELIRGLPEGSIQDGRRVDVDTVGKILTDAAVRLHEIDPGGGFLP